MPDAECRVIVLECAEAMQCDGDVLARGFAGRAPHEAEELLCRVLENIAYWLDVLHSTDPGASVAARIKAARRIALVARQIGLNGVALAADHVMQCLVQADPVALAATLARLQRLFDLAVTTVWDVDVWLP